MHMARLLVRCRPPPPTPEERFVGRDLSACAIDANRLPFYLSMFVFVCVCACACVRVLQQTGGDIFSAKRGRGSCSALASGRSRCKKRLCFTEWTVESYKDSIGDERMKEKEGIQIYHDFYPFIDCASE